MVDGRNNVRRAHQSVGTGASRDREKEKRRKKKGASKTKAELRLGLRGGVKGAKSVGRDLLVRRC